MAREATNSDDLTRVHGGGCLLSGRKWRRLNCGCTSRGQEGDGGESEELMIVHIKSGVHDRR